MPRRLHPALPPLHQRHGASSCAPTHPGAPENLPLDLASTARLTDKTAAKPGDKRPLQRPAATQGLPGVFLVGGRWELHTTAVPPCPSKGLCWNLTATSNTLQNFCYLNFAEQNLTFSAHFLSMLFKSSLTYLKLARPKCQTQTYYNSLAL